MRLSPLAVILAATTAMAAPSAGSGTTHVVSVQYDRILPQNTKAKEGDDVWFKFGPGFNSIAEFGYATPCLYRENGISSGVIETPEGRKYSSEGFVIKITSSDPIWYYNSYSDYCKKYSNVGSINSPETKDTSIYFVALDTLNAPRVDNPTEVKGGMRKEKWD